MADGKLSEQQISAFHRLLQHLPKDNDLSLLALKGHLLWRSVCLTYSNAASGIQST
jgi:hypothetical protein